MINEHTRMGESHADERTHCRHKHTPHVPSADGATVDGDTTQGPVPSYGQQYVD